VKFFWKIYFKIFGMTEEQYVDHYYDERRKIIQANEDKETITGMSDTSNE
jgi:hypothetical protein